MKQAIITGASKGLGKALAHQLAEMGYSLLLIARSEKILTELAVNITQTHKVQAHSLALDLSDPASAKTISTWCAQHQFTPSVLINNAGYACWGFFESMPIEQQEKMLQVNTGSLVNLTHAILPILKQQPQAYIMNIASTAAYQAVPTMALYAASKAFVKSFSRGLRYELRDTNVSVTCLSPGPMSTNFIQQAGMEAMQETAKKFEMPAEVVAKKGLRAMFGKKSESIPGMVNYLTVKFSNILPDALLEKIAANLYLTKLK
ncbi:MAG: SDR family oxidoreductase [Cyclobacteriaceae bacterium]|nr:SDR family oxidoreductase [Cyclobacteriaceae bacterium]